MVRIISVSCTCRRHGHLRSNTMVQAYGSGIGSLRSTLGGGCDLQSAGMILSP